MSSIPGNSMGGFVLLRKKHRTNQDKIGSYRKKIEQEKIGQEQDRKLGTKVKHRTGDKRKQDSRGQNQREDKTGQNSMTKDSSRCGQSKTERERTGQTRI